MDTNTQIRRYNRGEMADDERDAFELRLVNDASLAREVERDALLADAIDAPYVEASHVEAPRGARRGRRAARWRSVLPVAAGIGALGVAVGLFLRGGQTHYASVVHADLSGLRIEGPAAMPQKELVRSRDALVVVEMPALAGASVTQTIVVYRRGEHERWRAVGNVVPVDGVLSAAFAPDALAPGDYEFEAEAGDRRGPRFPLRIVERAAR